MLLLAEALLLLALDNKKGTVMGSSKTALPYGLAGALLLELSLQNRISLEGKLLQVSDPTPTSDSMLDEALRVLKAAKKPRSLKFWVPRLAGQLKPIKNRLADRLVKKNILRREDHKVFGIFPMTRFPARSTDQKEAIIGQVRELILKNREAETKTIVLISLIKACNLSKACFTPEEKAIAYKRIEEIWRGEKVGKAVSDTLTAVQSAVISAVSAAVITAAAASGDGASGA